MQALGQIAGTPLFLCMDLLSTSWITFNESFLSRAVLGFSVQNFVQVTGLGTALKILFSGDFDQDRGTEFSQSPRQDLPRLKPDLALTRNEVVSLFNAFGKISTSIVQLEKFREMLRKS